MTELLFAVTLAAAASIADWFLVGTSPLSQGTLILDALKGTIPAVVFARYGAEAGALAGFAAFIGHLFPVWLGFKGGKGVATYLGVLIGLAWQAALVFAAVWLVMALLLRYSSLSALTACIVVPVALYFVGHTEYALAFAVMSLLVFFKHKANISRLLAGNEGKIGAKG